MATVALYCHQFVFEVKYDLIKLYIETFFVNKIQSAAFSRLISNHKSETAPTILFGIVLSLLFYHDGRLTDQNAKSPHYNATTPETSTDVHQTSDFFDLSKTRIDKIID